MSERELVDIVKKLVKTYLEIKKTVEDVENELINTFIEPLRNLNRKYTIRRLINEILEDIRIED
ncbi:MAG: hypothetical protein GXO26_02410 [Crenarchaeota archaeon]|nr:hypothetical protein [Thermoproteota archaeon]